MCNVLGMIYENAIYGQTKHRHNIFTKAKRKNAQQCDISKIVLVILNPDHFWSTQFGGWKKTVSLEWVGHYAKVAVTTCFKNLPPAESPLLIASH